jgi:hypothetical protein
VPVGMKGSIFISYRRKETGAVAGRLRDSLRADGSRVFIDVVDIHVATRWRDEIQKAVSNCAVLLAVIGRDWLEMKDAHGRRRLDDSKDFMRVEIEAALQRDVPVIPVLIDDAETPESSELPTSLQAMFDRQAEFVRNNRFLDDYKHLKNSIDVYIKSPPYARALSAIAGLLLVLAGATFVMAGRRLTWWGSHLAVGLGRFCSCRGPRRTRRRFAVHSVVVEERRLARHGRTLHRPSSVSQP